MEKTSGKWVKVEQKNSREIGPVNMNDCPRYRRDLDPIWSCWSGDNPCCIVDEKPGWILCGEVERGTAKPIEGGFYKDEFVDGDPVPFAVVFIGKIRGESSFLVNYQGRLEAYSMDEWKLRFCSPDLDMYDPDLCAASALGFCDYGEKNIMGIAAKGRDGEILIFEFGRFSEDGKNLIIDRSNI